MIKKINKKALFGFSLMLSAVLGFFFATSKKYNSDMLDLITEIPLGSIERVLADDGGGDCSGSCDGTWNPAVTNSGVGITITNYTGSNGGVSFGGGCFVEGTKIALHDGSSKNIEQIITGDTVATSNGTEEVMKVFHIPFEGEVFAFNGSDSYFVTATHPFMTTDGWKSLDPEGTKKETPGLEVTQLTPGDTLYMNDGKKLKLEHIDSKKITTTVYNFTVNGSHDYYANDYLVHNVGIDFTKSKMKQLQMMK